MASWPSLSSNQIRESVFLVCLLVFLFVFKTGPCYIAQTDLKLGSFSFRLLDAGLEARTILTLPLLLMLFHLEHPKFL